MDTDELLQLCSYYSLATATVVLPLQSMPQVAPKQAKKGGRKKVEVVDQPKVRRGRVEVVGRKDKQAKSPISKVQADPEPVVHATLASFIDQMSSTGQPPLTQKMGGNSQSASYNMSNYASFGRTQPQPSFNFQSFAQKMSKAPTQSTYPGSNPSYFSTFTTPTPAKTPFSHFPTSQQSDFPSANTITRGLDHMFTASPLTHDQSPLGKSPSSRSLSKSRSKVRRKNTDRPMYCPPTAPQDKQSTSPTPLSTSYVESRPPPKPHHDDRTRETAISGLTGDFTEQHQVDTPIRLPETFGQGSKLSVTIDARGGLPRY